VELLILSLLRRPMKEHIQREMTNMQILGDLRNDPFYAPEFKRVEEESLLKGCIGSRSFPANQAVFLTLAPLFPSAIATRRWERY
jgi:hypothetical protein